MNDLLKWSIENSQTPPTDGTAAAADPGSNDAPPRQALNTEALRTLMGGPSEADLMIESMAAIKSPDVSLENKLIAFDNFEQLIESIDNANNMEKLQLWTPLVSVLQHEESQMRKYAAWCVGTAVQNNVKSQERVLALDAIPLLAKLAVEDTDEQVRRKAIYALSSEIRNYQPALDEAVKVLHKEYAPEGAIIATNMDAVDGIINKLREDAARQAQ